MKSRALRFAVATLFVGALGGAAYVTWIEESAGRAATAATRRFDDRAQLVSRTLLDIKGAQRGYVAAGQGDDYWAAKVDGLLGLAREGLAGLDSLSQAAPVQAEIESAAATFEDLEQLDRRARGYARSGQRLLASDLVFSDGLEKMDAAVAALSRARDADLAASEARVGQARRKQLLAVGGAAAAGLLVLVLLVPLPRDSSDAATPRATDATTDCEPAADFPVSTRVKPPRQLAPAVGPPAAPPAPSLSVDLAGIAAVCSELARVIDTRALPAALEHTAKLLQASGIVVWVADPDGRELIPVAAHGYPQSVLVRLGTIHREAENVTAAAYRTGVMQTVRSDATSPGAIAAPLLTPIGPVGVMAAEMLNDRERHDQTLSATAIVAAQLATLMAPPTQPPGKAEARA